MCGGRHDLGEQDHEEAAVVTSRDRVEAALRHREPDRTPAFEYVLLAPMADVLLGRSSATDPDRWPQALQAYGWEEAVRRMAADYVELAERLGHDLIYAVPNPLPPASGGPTAAAVPEVDGPVERLEQRNAMAALSDPSPPDETLLVYVFMREEMARRGLDLPLIAPAYAHGVWTDTDLMETMVLAPEVAREHFALATRRSLAAVGKYLKLGIDIIGVGGDFAGNRPILSPTMYREFIVPEVRTVARRIREGGAWSVNASDGNLWPVIEDFLIGCEVDGYLEIDWGAGMDLQKLKEAYGSRITFFGSLDCGSILSFSTPEVVAQHTIACIEAGWGGGGHILCASNAVTSSVPLENYLAAVNAYRAYFSLPPFRP
jgi:uroporphyrinogen-III decarboxylase